MKKKIIQILMLLVVAVSVGSFVSCKDTDEDLYNELRTQYIKDNASLQEAFDAQVAKLEEQIDTYKAALDSLEKAFAGFNSCECDSNKLKAVINGLTEQIESINRQIEILTEGLEKAATKEELAAVNHTIDLLTQQVNTIDGALKELIAAFNPLASDVAAAKAAQEIMQGIIDDLQDELRKVKEDLANVKQCECDYNYVTNKLVELETRMKAAEDQAKQALEFATDAKAAADAAKLAAQSAQNAAEQAQSTANTALELAQSAGLSADAANRLANEAKTAADIAKQTASDAKDLATAANNLATQTWEKVMQFETQLTSISDKAEEALNKASEAYAKAESNSQLISNLTADVASMKSEYDEKFANLTEKTNKLVEDLQHLTEVVGGNTERIGKLEEALKNLTETTLPGLTEKIDEMSEKLNGMETKLAELETQCANFLEEARLIAQAEVATAKAEILDYVFQNYVTKEQLENYATKEQLKDSVTAIMEKLLTELGKDRERIRANEVDIEWLKRLWSEATYKDIFERLTALEGATENIKNEVLEIINETLTEKITEVIKENIISGGDIGDEIINVINNFLEDGNYITEDDVEPIVDAIVSGASDGEIQSLVELVTLVSTLNGTVETLSGQVDTNTSDISDLKDRLDDVEDNIDGITDRLDDVEGRLDDVEDRLDDVEDAIEDLTADVAAIQNALAKQVTGIIIQGTFNPWFGTFDLPANIQSNVLVAFYGVPYKDVEFPTDDDQNYIRKDEVLTEKDMEMLAGVEKFEAPANLPLLNEDGNAGKVYMTINPNTADLEGLKLSIVNTLDEESPVKLKPIEKCNEKLQFGYTRADNGFYVADAYVTPKIVRTEDNGLALERDQIMELYNEVHGKIMDIANNFSNPDYQGSLHKLATNLYQVIQSLKADKTGLKCTYTTQEADGSEKEHSVYSQYNMASTFFKPLNLAWGKDFNYVTMPGYEFLSGLLDGIAATLKENLEVTSTSVTGMLQGFVNGLQIDELRFIGLTEDFIAKFEARVSSVTLNGVGYVIEAPGTGNFEIKFDKDLTAGGAAVTVPEAVAFDNENITEKRATLVVFGDIVNGLKLKMLVPARGGDDKVEAYATLVFDDSYATAKLIDGTIVLTVGEETYALAAYAGGNLSITSDCVDFVILKDCVGRDGSINLPVVLEFTNDVRDLLNEQKDILDNLVTELNAQLDKINNYGGAAWVDNFVDEYLRKYLDLINEDYCYFFNSINRRFGPFIVASNNGKGFKRLSLYKEYPTKMKKASLAFHPTTKNLELIVPIARKHVAVTNVFKGNASAQGGDADCKAKLQAANTGKLNTVVDGTVRRIDVTGMVPGYVYEVAYSVLDFDGNISTVKSYITIEE
ncbi:MAG: hypothetical protein IKU02_03775 [Bacteroidaceae bacterium]|nr:hypothetical protein [Bacteroidaceae bacterium]